MTTPTPPLPPTTTTTTTSSPSPPPTPPLLLALSGPTSSGKTTLATALRHIFSPPHYPLGPLLIHLDDFYKTDAEIPVTESGVMDWDCEGAIDWVGFGGAVGVVRGGRVDGGKRGGKREGDGGGEEGEGGERVRQGNFEGEMDMDGVHGVKGIGEGVIRGLSKQVESWSEKLKKRRIVIVDGFLLVGESVHARLGPGFFDVKILLRAGYEEAKRRRERRNGYVTLEGFWEDPEGYFEEVVWPGYVREHGWLFEGGDVEGVVRGEVVGREGVRVGECGWGLEGSLGWVVGVIKEGLEGGMGGG